MGAKELFTGERFIPGAGDDKLGMEHYQRYLGVREMVRGKTVLDAACGEGYGSDLMASVAKRVTGLDIDAATVERARVTYRERENLRFLQGSIEKIPLEKASVDAVISFETIEHVPEQVQKSFLEEISRVLKADGFLVMSTPNKKIYSDLYSYQNEFHVKEFYREEFVAFLRQKFRYVELYEQAFRVVSMMDREGGGESKLIYYASDEMGERDGKYYIALASNVPVKGKGLASVYLGDAGEYDRTVQRILKLQGEEEERNRHIRELDREARHAGEVIRGLQEENEERNAHIRHLDQEMEERDGRILGLTKEKEERETENRRLVFEVEERNALIRKLNVEADQREEYVRRLKKEGEEKEGQIRRLEREGEEKEEQIRRLEGEGKEKENLIRSLESEHEEQVHRLGESVSQLNLQLEQTNKVLAEKEALLSAHNGELDELKQIIRNKEGHIELLLEVERRYEHEKNTHSYRFGKKVQRVGDFVLPPNSRRRFFAQVVYQLFRKPKLMLHVINPKRIRHYMKYKKLEGMEGVVRRYKEAVDLERSYIEPAAKLELAETSRDTEGAAGEKAREYEKLYLPQQAEPKVSVIIPVYNQFDYTYNCVKSILQNSGDIPYEVIIADDCSTDTTREIDKIIANIRVVTTEQNLRFLKNCNNAAKQARGEYILFLNNDTQVQKDWLAPLVELIERDESIGMVGSMLLYPDGFLQEAGGIVWKDASAWNFGHRRNPEDPEFNYVKEADYISGAAVMIRRALWEEIGGFDEQFAPAYYEDTDLAFEVRRHGYKVLYQPLSRVVHFEGISNGTDVQTGLKQYQQVNFRKFYEKWKDVLGAEHEVNGENVFTAKDRSGRRKHILVVDHYVPHHDKDAGGKCTFMYLRTFVKMGFQVTFIGDNFYKHEPYTTELNQMGIEVLYGNYYYNNWKQWLKDNCHYFDYIYLQRPHISIKYIDIVKTYSRAKIFYFAHDLHHIREYREFEMTGDPEKLASSRKWKKIEYELFEKADVGHVVGSFEQQKMQEAFPGKPIRNIPLYIYETLPQDMQKDFTVRKDILYVGGFGHPPNVDAVLWFAREVFPRILERYPDIRWHVVGGNPPLEVQQLASEHILIEGFLPDESLEKLYRECRMSVVPLRFGAGVKGKVVEAAYYQIPLLTTSIGAEGLSREEGFMKVEDTAEGFADVLCSLYEDYLALREMSDNGIRFIRNHFTLEEAERVLRLDIDI